MNEQTLKRIGAANNGPGSVEIRVARRALLGPSKIKNVGMIALTGRRRLRLASRIGRSYPVHGERCCRAENMKDCASMGISNGRRTHVRKHNGSSSAAEVFESAQVLRVEVVSERRDTPRRTSRSAKIKMLDRHDKMLCCGGGIWA